MNKNSSVILVFLFLIIATNCTTPQSLITEAAGGGFTTELDEPSLRGQLTSVTPPQMNIKYNYEFSPDGEEILYSAVQAGSGGDGLLHLWKLPLNGESSPVKITSGGNSNQVSPSYTSDGEYIVYASDGDLWMINSDGSGAKRMLPGSSGYDFSPNVSSQDEIVFCSLQSSGSSNQSLIWISNLDGSYVTQIREGIYPRWSPNGERIVFEHNGDIWLIDKNGRNLQQLTSTSDSHDGLPSFSPDGNSIIFSSNRAADPNDWNIWTMNIDGSNLQQLTELTSWDSWPNWTDSGIYFQSGRAQPLEGPNNQRLWHIQD